MIVLSLDTAAPHCAVAVWQDGRIIAHAHEPMARGQVEHLLPLADNILTEQGLTFRDIDAIGVGIGPGNFTGVRICVSAARGLALSLGVQAIGISRFDVLDHRAPHPALAIICAPQDRVYARSVGGDIRLPEPRLMPRNEAEAFGLPMLEEPGNWSPAPDIALLAAARVGTQTPRPAPLYLKVPDAAPAKDTPPRILP